MNTDRLLRLLGEHGACLGHPADMFFPQPGQDGRAAKTVCAGCPVRAECLDFALAADARFGVWGGLTETERDKLRRRQARRKNAAAP